MAHPVETVRHSLSHVMAEAVVKLYPGTKVAIGPAIEDGFYYDFQLPSPISAEDFPAIEKEMRRIIASNATFKRIEVAKAEALAMFADEPYKLELIEGLEDGAISVYEQGSFRDLCRGPHVDSTRDLKPDAFKLRSVAGAYWRGDEKRPMLTRIYAYAFNGKAELEAYLKMLEEAEKRDNRKLGKELDLFSTHEEAGPGLIYWHPKGGRFRVELEKWWREEHYKNGYEILFTPHVGKSWLWQTSGHLGFYKEGMYPPMEMDEDKYYAKPMNCPFHIMIYKNDVHSYRELPMRWAELGTVYRYERAGALHGLMRVRGFTQDDAHIFCTEEQVKKEAADFIKLTLKVYGDFGFTDIAMKLSTRPAKRVGSDELWERAEGALAEALNESGLAWEYQPGEGAFYGPKIEFTLRDCLGRNWQCGTLQYDPNLPERLDASFVAEDNSRQRPVMLHRAILGSFERFIGMLIEHYAGAFPAWLAPTQAVVMNITDKQAEFALEVEKTLNGSGFRAKADLRNEKIGFKIREHTLLKVPYLLVIGDREVETRSVAVRTREGVDLGSMPLETFVAQLQQAVSRRGRQDSE